MQALLFGALFFLAISAGLFIPLEFLFPRVEQRTRARRMALCAGLFIFNTLLMSAVGGPLLRFIAERIPENPSLERILAALLIGDLLGYLVHRAMHRSPLLWKLHRVHHADVELTWLEAWRQHPLDFVVHGFAVALPGALLGASLSDLVAVVLIRKAWTSFLHANVRFRFGPLEWLIATPAFHLIHHSRDPRLFDRNFAGTFPLWDLVFGTYATTEVTTEAAPVGSRPACPAGE